LKLQEHIIASFQSFGHSVANTDSLAIQNIRHKALENFKLQGFPSTKNEDWKYTSLNKCLKRDYQLSASQETQITPEQVDSFLCSGIDAYTLVFVNGFYNEALSSSVDTDIFKVMPLKSRFKGQDPIFNSYYNNIADGSQAMTALNTAYAQEGAFVYVKAGAVVDKLVQVLFLNTHGQEALMLQPRNLFVVEERAQVEILERHQSINDKAVFTNVVTESVVGAEANFKHYKIQNDLETASLVDSTFVRQDAKSSALVDTFAFNGEITRNNLHFEFTGMHAEAHMDAITLLKGSSHVDHHTFVDHAVPNCQSNQLYKGIYDEKSKGVFNGKVMVRKDAQKTNAFQQNNNLLMSDFASIDTKPQLEIFADDVACSHGCTIGQLDEEALFYMQSRGIPKKEAQAFLTFAFAGDTLKNISSEKLKTQLITLLAKELKVDLELNELEH
jgi:Fe-S cluster assembly protein SufD